MEYTCAIQRRSELALPVATVTGGSGTVTAVSYSTNFGSFGAVVNNRSRVIATFNTSHSSHLVTASVSDSTGQQTCTFSVVLTEGKNCNISIYK